MQIVLPTSDSPCAWHGVQTPGGQATTTPVAKRATVLVVPWSWLSWHRITVPPNSHRQLRAVAASLLEDEVLQPTDQLHLSFDPQAHAVARQGGEITVAVCDAQRLRRVWQDLASRSCLPERIVPELWPSADGAQLHWLQTPSHVVRVWAHPKGLTAMPDALAWAPGDLAALPLKRLTTEPSLAQQVEAWAARLQPKPRLEVQDLNARLIAAAQGPWSLAQGDFKAQHPWVHGLRSRWHWLRHARAARPWRWGVIALVSVQGLGWGLGQWQQQAQLWRWQARIDQAFARALPQTPQLDAPAQLSQTLRRLEQQLGVPSPSDLPALLAAWGQALPDHPLSQWHYQNDVLHAEGLDAQALAAVRAAPWANWGLQAEVQATQASLRVRPTLAPASPKSLAERAMQVQALAERIEALRQRPRNPDQARAALQTLTSLKDQQGQWRFTATEAELQARGVSATQLGQWLTDWPALARMSVMAAEAAAADGLWQVQLTLRLPTPSSP